MSVRSDVRETAAHPATAARPEAARTEGFCILHCIAHLSGGGAERQLAYLAAEQRARGHEVHVAYLSNGGQATRLGSLGVVLHPIRARGNHDPRLLVAVRGLIRTVAPDVLQSWVLQMDVVAGVCARATGVPWVLREPASVEHYRGWKGGLRVALARKASAIVANSAAGAAYWRQRFTRASVRVIHNGIPLPAIEAAPAQRWQSADGAERPFVLFAGRLEPQKNLERLLRAFALVVEKRSIHAVWCGEGTLRGRLQVLADELGVADRVAFLGQQPAETVWGLMKSARVFTFVSRYEGLPNAVLEAVACRCPLLLSDIPAHRELLPEAELVAVDDERAIARGLAELLDSPEQARRTAQMALARVCEWSIAGMADAYDRVYREVAARRGL